jgi:hypothetical protein
MAKYDTRNRFQKAADIKGSTYCCIATALFFLALTACLVVLLLTNNLGFFNDETSGSLSPIQVSQY